MIIRDLGVEDCRAISLAFADQGWQKPESQYRQYLNDQQNGLRDVLVAELQREFAAYLTIQWQSGYWPFQLANIPEIVDLNVLKKFQRQGVATALLDEAERRVKKVSDTIGIGFGLTSDYGAAQILYVRRGYVPDGRGLVKDSIPLKLGATVVVNHDLVIFLTKAL